MDTHNLQFHGLALKLNCSYLEVDTNRADIALRVRIVRETQQETTLQKGKTTK